MSGPNTHKLVLVGLMQLAAVLLSAEQIGRAVTIAENGNLTYEQDALGNQLPDFSTAGYGGGGVPLPHVPTLLYLLPGDESDDTKRIQAAIDHVADLPAGENGIRGAVLLKRGEYRVSGQLQLRESGVVLRGEGDSSDGTVIVATGTGRRTLIVGGAKSLEMELGNAVAVIDRYVPVGAKHLRVADANSFAVGDNILIERASTSEWLEQIGMHIAPARTHYRWREGRLELSWQRRITAIRGDELHLDAPIVTALEEQIAPGSVREILSTARLSQIGIEHLRLVSEVDATRPKDEDHAWMGIQLDNLENAWVAGVTGMHFVSSVVDLGSGARAVTVQDCHSRQPISEDGGYRRHSFHTRGQQTLFMRCTAEFGRHDFTAGFFAGGPNVFLNCEAKESSGISGSIGSWASGLLMDNMVIDGGVLALDNLEVRYGGVGWAAANSVLWQSAGSRVICRSPAGALNWAIGVWGEFYGEGRWQQANEFINPDSLYRAQLQQRMGEQVLQALQPLVPRPAGDAELWTETPDNSPAPESTTEGLRVENGWLVADGGLVIGGEAPVTWWRGNLLPSRTAEHQPHLTRFLPGRIEPGGTEDLNALVEDMVANNHAIMRHHYGLWYDRRREDHQMIRRVDGDVWPPFYEMPWARSGVGRAWDGLSRYDLERFNPWFFSRLREFADLAREEGRVLINEMYFQHNILEAGAHWAEFPWRSANAIQQTGFTEPPDYIGGKRIAVAKDFYNVDHPLRRELHRKYIRKSLSNLAGQPNVLHSLSEEYTGPLHFMRFWLEVIAEWKQETGQDVLVSLSAPKDVQDAILADPQLSPHVDVVEFKYWFESDRGLFAPDGDQDLAPRQHLRQWNGGRSSPHNIASMIDNYKQRYPEKAIIVPTLSGAEGWTVLMSGGSIPDLPPGLDDRLRQIIPALQPIATGADGVRMLGNGRDELLVQIQAGAKPVLPIGKAGDVFKVFTVNGQTGFLGPLVASLRGGEKVPLPSDPKETKIYWITLNP